VLAIVMLSLRRFLRCEEIVVASVVVRAFAEDDFSKYLERVMPTLGGNCFQSKCGL